MHDLLDIPLIGVDQLEDSDQVAVLGDHFLDDGLVAVRTSGFGCLILEELLHAGRAATVQIGTDDHRGVFIGVILAHAEEALLLYLVGYEGLDLLAH